jgi:hypothetical protein
MLSLFREGEAEPNNVDGTIGIIITPFRLSSPLLIYLRKLPFFLPQGMTGKVMDALK